MKIFKNTFSFLNLCLTAVLIMTLFLFFASIAGCTWNSKSKQYVNEYYEDTKITGWRPFVCGEGELYATGFETTTPYRKQVTGTVCAVKGFAKPRIIMDGY